jgi:hypothetical protein
LDVNVGVLARGGRSVVRIPQLYDHCDTGIAGRRAPAGDLNFGGKSPQALTIQSSRGSEKQQTDAESRSSAQAEHGTRLSGRFAAHDSDTGRISKAKNILFITPARNRFVIFNSGD